MKKTIIIILSAWATTSVAQNTKPMHISVVQGVSTEGNESKNNDYYFSFNLFSGTVRNIKGVEIGSLYNQNDGDMTGFQASGLLNITKGNVKGYQTAGLTNVSGSVIGFQEAGLSNHAKNVYGVQASGVVNTAHYVKGAQLAGVYNQAKTLKGLQVGLINVADSVERGGGIGLINLYKKGGYREIEVSVADYQNVGLSYKSGTKKLYSILNIGYNYNPETLFSTGFGIGRIVELRRNLFFKPEIIWYNYINDDFNFNTTVNSGHLKVGIMKQVGKLGLTLSPSIYYANTPKGFEGKMARISKIEPFSQTDNSRWGYGVSFGIAFLK